MAYLYSSNQADRVLSGSSVTLTGSTGIELRFSEGANYVGFEAPPAGLSANQIWSLPSADGSNGQQLTTDGSGALSWAAAGSATIANDAANKVTTADGDGTFSAEADLVFNGFLEVGSAAGSGVDVKMYTAGTAAHVGVHWDADLNTEGTLKLGVDDHGVDLIAYGEASGKYMHWDMSGNELIITGELDQRGTAKFGTAAGTGADLYMYTAGTAAHVGIQWDANGNTEGTLIGGADDHGVDFKFFGESSGKYVQWDMSGDELVLASSAKLSFNDAAGGEYVHASADNVLELFAGTDIKLNTDTITMTSANASDPLVIVKNTTNDTNGARLRFVKDKGAAAADDDVVGLVEFYGDNDAQEQTLFAQVKVEIADASNGTEGANLELGIASHDGGMETGLALSDGDADGEVDVTIGAGTSSITTTAGVIKVTTVANPGSDLDKILVYNSSGGLVGFRTGAEIASDIGATSTSAANAFTGACSFENSAGLIVRGDEGNPGILYLNADQGDDAGDEWKINVADGGVMTFGNDIASAGTFVTHMTMTPHATIASSVIAAAGDLTVGDDLSLTSDASVFNMGAGNDFTITHDGTTGATIAGNPITITAAGASTWSTSAGALTVSGKTGINLSEDGTAVIAIDTNRDVLFSQTGGSTSDPDVEIDGYFVVDGTTELNGTVQIDGATTHNAAITVGTDGTGYDVKFFGDAASAYALWDESANYFKVEGQAMLSGSSIRARKYEQVIAKTSGYTMDPNTGNENVILVDTDGGAFEIVLPTAANSAQRVITFKDADGNCSAEKLTITRSALATGNRIDGQISIYLDTNYASVSLLSDGSHWYIL